MYLQGATSVTFATAGLCLIVTILVACQVILVFRINVRYSTFVSALALVCTVGVLLVDLENAVKGVARMWAAVVLIMDLCLIIGCGQWVQMVIIVFTLVVVAAEGLESYAHYGLYELVAAGLPPGRVERQCDCSEAPCKRAFMIAIIGSFTAIVVFITDFYATRGFALGLRAQMAANDAAVHVAERVAGQLAAYATDEARRVVAKEGSAMPAALRQAYEQLLDNLDSYRVFLPDSLLNADMQTQSGMDNSSASQSDAEQEHILRQAPGTGLASAELAICFTDIQSSTELWEAHPQGMYQGLILHNTVMRKTYAACNGYEVKTIGDSFMVAFDSVSEALRFGLEAQLRLLRQDWPADLLTHHLCEKVPTPSGDLLWGGLRVRIGVQSGPTRIDRNPVTGRCDYFGPTVNTAARLEAVLRKGGLIATSDTVVAAVGQEQLAALGSPVLYDAGLRELKGVKEPMRVHVLVPQALAKRLAVLSEESEFLNFSADMINTPLGGGACSTGGSSSASTPVNRGSVGTLTSLGSRGIAISQQGSKLAAGARTTALARRLRPVAVTCAAVRATLHLSEPVAERFASFAGAAAVAADQTHGVVDCLLSASVVVTWNASRVCVDHTAACRQFIAAQFRVPCHLGAASGLVLHGNVAAGRRSFATVIGGSVELSAALAEEAEICGDRALAVGAIAAECVANGTAFCAQLWEAPGSAPLTAFAIVLPDGQDKWVVLSSDCSEDEAEADPLAQSVYETRLCEAGTGQLRKVCAAPPGSADIDEVLAELDLICTRGPARRTEWASRLAERIRSGHARSRQMPTLWHPGDAHLRSDDNLLMPAGNVLASSWATRPPGL